MSEETIPSNEQRYYDVLDRIVNRYASATDLAQRPELRQGLDYGEALEEAYQNIQEEAAAAIRGRRRPEK